MVKLVDFAHTFPNAEGDNTFDNNFLSSLLILVSLWEAIALYGREIFENQRHKAGAWGKDTLLRSGERLVCLFLDLLTSRKIALPSPARMGARPSR